MKDEKEKNIKDRYCRLHFEIVNCIKSRSALIVILCSKQLLTTAFLSRRCLRTRYEHGQFL